MRTIDIRRRPWQHDQHVPQRPDPVTGGEKAMTRMGAMIEHIWIGKTSACLGAHQLVNKIGPDPLITIPASGS
jgi:hypothetical protein